MLTILFTLFAIVTLPGIVGMFCVGHLMRIERRGYGESALRLE